LSDVVWIHSQQDLEDVIASGERVVVDFTAPAWCVPCQQFAPHYERAAENVEGITFLAVDVDNNDWAMLKYGIRGVPTVKLYDNAEFIRDVKAPQGALPFINDIKE
jgi:thiol-disulfide isomerase/thioredoxin